MTKAVMFLFAVICLAFFFSERLVLSHNAMMATHCYGINEQIFGRNEQACSG